MLEKYVLKNRNSNKPARLRYFTGRLPQDHFNAGWRYGKCEKG